MRRGGPGGHMGAMMKGDKARDFKGTMGKLLDYLGSYKIGILVVMLFAIASTVFTIIGPKILGRATTKLFEGVLEMIAGTGGGIDFDFIGRIILTTITASVKISLKKSTGCPLSILTISARERFFRGSPTMLTQ